MKSFKEYLLEAENLNKDVILQQSRKQFKEKARELGLQLLRGNNDVFISRDDLKKLADLYNRSVSEHKKMSVVKSGVYYIPPEAITNKDGWRLERFSYAKSPIHLVRISSHDTDFEHEFLRKQPNNYSDKFPRKDLEDEENKYEF